MKSGGRGKPTTIDEYLAALSDDKRAALERLRKAIHAAAPRAEECISYQLPAFRLDGKMLVWFGASAKHCSFYPGAVLQGFKRELAPFQTSKGTIRFQPDKPLSVALVRKLAESSNRTANDIAVVPTTMKSSRMCQWLMAVVQVPKLGSYARARPLDPHSTVFA